MRTRWIAVALLACVTVGCADSPSSTSSTVVTTPVLAGATTWALGDSQGAYSNDPARGLPWSSRIGATVGNGADGMQGAGWTVPGTYSLQTMAQRATALTKANTVKRFIVMAGVNDLGAGKTVAQMLDGVTTFASAASAAGASVLYVGIVPFPSKSYVAPRNADRIAFNKALATRFGANYVDCSASMSDSSGWLLANLSLAADNLHLNSAGEQALANCILAKK